MKLYVTILAMFLVIVLSIVSNSFAQNKGDDIVIGNYDKIHSKILSEDRLLLINLPEGYEKNKIDYPVVYLFYGDRVMQYFSPTVTEIDKLSSDGFIPQMIVVGIANNNRYRDFLPVNNNGINNGTNNFLGFLNEELFPYIEQNYRTKDSRIFISPQASGAFGLELITKNPEMFDACFMNNPFRWPASREFLMNRTTNYLKTHPNTKSYIYSSFSLNDQLDKDGLEYIKKWEESVKNLQLSNFIVDINFQEESDDFVSSMELKTGLKRYYKDYKFPEDIEIQDLSDIKNYYTELSKKYGYVIDEPDLVLTLESDKLKNKGETEKSKEILKYILTKYPESLNAIWRLANICREESDTIKAIEYYKKSVELNPDMAPARIWIEKLEKKD